MPNRVETHAAELRSLIRSGRKPDGSPIGDMETLTDGLALSDLERMRWQEIKTVAVDDGTLSVEEGMTIYRAIGEAGSDRGWPKRTDLAMRTTVTMLMAQLFPHYLGRVR